MKIYLSVSYDQNEVSKDVIEELIKEIERSEVFLGLISLNCKEISSDSEEDSEGNLGFFSRTHDVRFR